MAQQKKKDVFISYSRKDSVIADEICKAFDQVGITYFIDREEIKIEKDYIEKIANGIDNSKIVLFLASTTSYTSKYVNIELQYAFDKEVLILPYQIDNAAITKKYQMLLSSVNWYNINEHPINPTLIETIAEHVGKEIDFDEINKSVEPNPLEVKKVVNEESKIRMSETLKHLRLRKDESEEKWDVNKALALLPDYFKDDVFLFSKDYDNGGVKIIYNTDYRIKSLIEIPSSISFKDQVFKVTGISNEAFYGCNKLEVITIPNSVVCIEEYAFKNCKSLVSITLSKNITYIGKGAFSGCTSLKSIDVPNGVKRLDYDVFLECTSLREITLPASIEEVEYSAFQGCDSIKKVFIPSSMKKKYAHLLTRGMYKNVVCEQEPKNQKIKWIILCSIVLGISLLIIGVLAFSRKILQFEYDNTDMTATVMEKQPTFRVTGDVEIPSHVNRLGKVYTVTKIGDNAFKDAYSVAHVTIPSSISYIGSNAFSNCSSLTTIIIPNSVRDLSSCAFEKCIGLTSVTIGKNIQYISSFAFSECVSLDSIYYTGTIKQWERIIKGGFWVDKVPADVIHCVDGDVELRR